MLDSQFEGDLIGEEADLIEDAGPLMIRAKGGRHFQFVDFDIPRIAAAIMPDEFHVTSQPMPCVIEGGHYEYQVKVNRPELVAGYKLRSAAPNTTISPAGLLRYNSPNGLKAPMRAQFSIEIRGQRDRTVLHEFEMIVVPKSNPNGLKSAGKAL